MWMMGYNEAADFNLQDSFNGRKFRPLIPRPTPSSSSSHFTNRTHDLLAFNHHMASMNEQSKREFNTQQVIVSSRWNPTTEQLQMLEDLYRRGTRTPSTEEIQEITAQLRRYGKIEGKNVFYWFQNHKARERQKRRRQLESTAAAAAADHQPHQSFDQREETHEKKDYSGGPNRSTGFEAEQAQAKNWPPPTNCHTLSERTVSIQEAAKVVAASSEFRADGRIQFNEGELHQRRTLAERNATWQMKQLSCSSHINYTTSTISPTTVRSTLDPKFIPKPQQQDHLSIFMNPKISTRDHLNYFFGGICDRADDEITAGYDHDYEDNEKSQTLQLFPLQSEDMNGDDQENGDNWVKHSDNPNCSMASIKNLTPNQFFEFLPLKN